jgi:hypothetical protein
MMRIQGLLLTLVVVGCLIITTASAQCQRANPALVIDTVRFVRPCQYDVLLNDITEDELRLIAQMDGVSYLGPSNTVPEFPVEGTIVGGNKRFMVNLLVRRRRASEYMNVVFMVDTGSPYTFLSRSAMEAVTGPGADNLPAALRLEIHGNQSMVCYMSPPDKHFADINLLGTDFLELNGAQIHVDWAQRTFLLDFKN